MRVIFIFMIVVAAIGFVTFTPVVNDMLMSNNTTLVAPIASNITNYTANSTTIYTMGALQSGIAGNFGLIIMLIALAFIVMTLIKGLKGQEETE